MKKYFLGAVDETLGGELKPVRENVSYLIISIEKQNVAISELSNISVSLCFVYNKQSASDFCGY